MPRISVPVRRYIETPTTYESSGVVWSVRGRPGSARTVIKMLVRGNYAQCIRKHPEIVDLGVQTLAEELRNRAPVDTGMLRSSIRINPMSGLPSVTLGPEPYNRTAMKAALAGRTVRRRRGGRPRLSKYYAIYANRSSRRPNYIEDSLIAASREVARACRQYVEMEENLSRLEEEFLRRASLMRGFRIGI